MTDKEDSKSFKNFSDMMSSPEFIDLEGERKDIKLDPYEHLSQPAQDEIRKKSK